MTKQIGILGSMFDPPHWGHFLVAEQVLEYGPSIDEVWFMPAYTHPFGKKSTAPHHRLAMTRYLESSALRVATEEMDCKTTSYTINTVRLLKKTYPHKFYWIIGSDNMKDFFRWKNSDALVDAIPFIVFPRPGYPIGKLPASFRSISPKKVIVSGISSTNIRSRVLGGKSIKGLVPEKVAGYIKKHHLYK